MQALSLFFRAKRGLRFARRTEKKRKEVPFPKDKLASYLTKRQMIIMFGIGNKWELLKWETWNKHEEREIEKWDQQNLT